MSIALVMPPSHLIPWCPLLLLPSIFPSIRDFSSESSVHIRWPKYWSFSFSISPFNEYLGLISLKIDWFDLFAVQGTLRSLLQHHSLKASVLWHSAFFMVQFLQPQDKASACHAGQGSIPGLGRSLGKGNGNHSSILAWRIPWTEELGRLQSTESQRVRHDWASSLHFSQPHDHWEDHSLDYTDLCWQSNVFAFQRTV